MAQGEQVMPGLCPQHAAPRNQPQGAALCFPLHFPESRPVDEQELSVSVTATGCSGPTWVALGTSCLFHTCFSHFQALSFLPSSSPLFLPPPAIFCPCCWSSVPRHCPPLLEDVISSLTPMLCAEMGGGGDGGRMG